MQGKRLDLPLDPMTSWDFSFLIKPTLPVSTINSSDLFSRTYFFFKSRVSSPTTQAVEWANGYQRFHPLCSLECAAWSSRGIHKPERLLENRFLYLGPHPGHLYFCSKEKAQPRERPWPLGEALLSGKVSSTLWNWFALLQTEQLNFL